MAPTTLRPARPTDIDAIVDFQVAMALETESLRLDAVTVRHGVTTVIQTPSMGEYLIAERDQQPVACLMLLKEWSDWRAKTVLWIHSVYVVPGSRKLGVFRQMYDHVRQRVDSNPELAGIRLFVDRRNVNAQRAYEAAGMSAEHYALYEWLK